MASSTEIANMATSHLAISTNIANLDTSKGPNAEACRRFFDIAANTVQREIPMAFATDRVLLGLIREDPNDEYQFEYTYPANCQIAGRLISGLITDNRQTQLQYKIMHGTSSRVIWTNVQEAELEFQLIITDESRYVDDVVLALSFKLAELIAPRVTGGDPFGLGPKAEANYLKAITTAQANSLNEQQEQEDPQSEFVRAQFVDPLFQNGSPWTAFPDDKDLF